MHKILEGDCAEKLSEIEDASIDSIVTDPPYGLGFMGKKWDIGVPAVDVFEECLRVLKPGGHLLAFGGSRTYHRLAVAVEDAGFEIRDQIMWVYGSGFPKSMNVAKAIESGGRPEDIRRMQQGDDYRPSGRGRVNYDHGAASAMDAGAVGWSPTTDTAKRWGGWGTALKPAHEPIVVARKPLTGTVAANVLEHGTGALNIDGCRVGEVDGRWPANLIHDGSEEVLAAFPEAKGQQGVAKNDGEATGNAVYGAMCNVTKNPAPRIENNANAARFFYCAKASRQDRNEGCDELEEHPLQWSSGSQTPGSFQSEGTKKAARNHHPTVKPTELMRYLCRLVTPPGGTVLDPFMGSGSTGKAAILEEFGFIGIERDPQYVAIAEARIGRASEAPKEDQRDLFDDIA